MDLALYVTEDGSHSLKRTDLQETFHSRHGAIQESRHVFIESGFTIVKDRMNLNILEVGFGTGLNAYLTLLNQELHQQILYTSYELWPLEKTWTDALNYPKMLMQPQALFLKLHEVAWGDFQPITSTFMLKKQRQSILELEDSHEKFNLVYFDAFAPDIQPELWTSSLFLKLYNQLEPGGLLVTYCAKGSVKRALQEAGFKVEKRQGPPGKREMMVAFKI